MELYLTDTTTPQGRAFNLLMDNILGPRDSEQQLLWRPVIVEQYILLRRAMLDQLNRNSRWTCAYRDCEAYCPVGDDHALSHFECFYGKSSEMFCDLTCAQREDEDRRYYYRRARRARSSD